MRIATVLYNSIANGPGRRNVLWVQGCHIRCPGCMNKQLWDAHGGSELSADEVVDLLLAGDPEGITISGGEPLIQANELEEVLKGIRLRKPEISIILFTGLEGKNLDYCYYWIFEHVDVVITGPFKEEESEGLVDLRGSRNQRIWFISDKHKPEDLIRQTDVEILIDDVTNITGFPTADAARTIQENLGA